MALWRAGEDARSPYPAITSSPASFSFGRSVSETSFQTYGRYKEPLKRVSGMTHEIIDAPPSARPMRRATRPLFLRLEAPDPGRAETRNTSASGTGALRGEPCCPTTER